MFKQYSSYDHYLRVNHDFGRIDFLEKDNRPETDVFLDATIDMIENLIEVLFKKYEKINSIKMHIDNSSEVIRCAYEEKLSTMPSNERTHLEEHHINAQLFSVNSQEYMSDLNKLYFIGILADFEGYWGMIKTPLSRALNGNVPQKTTQTIYSIKSFLENLNISCFPDIYWEELYDFYTVRNILIHYAGRLSLWAKSKNYKIKNAYASEGWIENAEEIINIIEPESYPDNHVLKKVFEEWTESPSNREERTKSFITAINKKKYEIAGLTVSYDTFLINTEFNNYMLDIIGNFLKSLQVAIAGKKNIQGK